MQLERRLVNGEVKIGLVLTEMPFSSSFVSFNPNRICLLDKGIPVPWRVTLGRIPVDRVLIFP